MNLATDTELKGLMTRQKKARADLHDASVMLAQAKQEHQAKKTLVDELQKRIDELVINTGDQIVITEHALLRWIERAMGFNLDEIRQSMIDPRTAAAIKALRTCDVKTEKGFTLKVKNCNVITVLEND